MKCRSDPDLPVDSSAFLYSFMELTPVSTDYKRHFMPFLTDLSGLFSIYYAAYLMIQIHKLCPLFSSRLLDSGTLFPVPG